MRNIINYLALWLLMTVTGLVIVLIAEHLYINGITS